MRPKDELQNGPVRNQVDDQSTNKQHRKVTTRIRFWLFFLHAHKLTWLKHVRKVTQWIWLVPFTK
jgi:hypothetical protein